MVLRLSVPEADAARSAEMVKRTGFVPEPVHATRLQDRSIGWLAAEAQVRVAHEPKTVRFADATGQELCRPRHSRPGGISS